MITNNCTSIDFASLFSNTGFKEHLKGCIRCLVKEDKEFRDEIKTLIAEELDYSFDSRLSRSEFHPVQRVYEIENAMGIEETDDEDEEEKPTVLCRIQTLEDKITNYKPGLTVSPQIEIKQKTKTGKRAMHLIKTLMASGKGHLTHAQIKTALSDETLEDCRITPDCSNPRRIIIDALNEAERICSSVMPTKKGYGRHEWRLLLKS